ncbi:MAG: hypothetical protein Q9170_007612, partial [Blastenia crenularia]
EEEEQDKNEDGEEEEDDKTDSSSGEIHKLHCACQKCHGEWKREEGRRKRRRRRGEAEVESEGDGGEDEGEGGKKDGRGRESQRKGKGEGSDEARGIREKEMKGEEVDWRRPVGGRRGGVSEDEDGGSEVLGMARAEWRSDPF